MAEFVIKHCLVSLRARTSHSADDVRDAPSLILLPSKYSQVFGHRRRHLYHGTPTRIWSRLRSIYAWADFFLLETRPQPAGHRVLCQHPAVSGRAAASCSGPFIPSLLLRLSRVIASFKPPPLHPLFLAFLFNSAKHHSRVTKFHRNSAMASSIMISSC